MTKPATLLPIYDDIIASVISIASRNKTGDIPQHILICGQEGTGKTIFLTRLTQRLSGLPLAPLPLAFPYAHTGTVDRIIAQAQASGRNTVLLIDDFHLLLDSLSIDEQYRLRAFLFRKGAPMLIGTSHSHLPAISDYRAPFYDAFRLFFLRPADSELQAFLPPHLRHRLSEVSQWETVRQLIVGNLQYGQVFAEAYASSQDLAASLSHLLAVNARYFKFRFLSLSSVQQQILLGIASTPGAVSLASIRDSAGIESTGLTSALKRLIDLSVIRQVGLKKRNYTYAFTDLLFQEWLQRLISPKDDFPL